MTHKRIGVVDNDTAIVIEGYPRSANTMAVVAFQMAQPEPVEIAHHVHGAAQVLWAVEHEIPVIVLVRNPIDAVASLIVRYPSLSLKNALAEYRDFYSMIKPVKERCVVADFDSVLANFGGVITAVNDKFGTRFFQFAPTKENMKECFARIDEFDRADRGAKRVNKTTVARPTASRHELTKKIKEQLASEDLRTHVNQCMKLYVDMLA